MIKHIKTYRFGMIFFDEAEKCADLFQDLLQFFQEGIIEEGPNKADFKNGIIFLASNFPSHLLTNPIYKDFPILDLSPNWMREELIDQISIIFSGSRFFNRIGYFIPFFSHTKEMLKEILSMNLIAFTKANSGKLFRDCIFEDSLIEEIANSAILNAGDAMKLLNNLILSEIKRMSQINFNSEECLIASFVNERYVIRKRKCENNKPIKEL
eukprot:Anaeramoba_ignava/a479834_12.p1 GENE.a479834_12~~a479834_12.p1  ORF type:complete len:211 (+),score=56.66 a479834_12:531-1163(+)